MQKWLYFKNLVDRKKKLLPVRINQLFCHAKSEPKNVIAITIEKNCLKQQLPSAIATDGYAFDKT